MKRPKTWMEGYFWQPNGLIVRVLLKQKASYKDLNIRGYDGPNLGPKTLHKTKRRGRK